MGYFDGLTNRTFKKDKNGNTVFFPWGVLGRGRVLPDVSTETRVRGFVSRYYLITLPIVIGVGAILGWAWSFLLVPVCGAWFYFGTKPLVSDLPYSDEKLTIKEVYTNSAESHNKFTLWILLIGSVLFVLAGIFIAATAKSSSQMMLGLFSIVFFGTVGTAIGYMLKVKHS